MEVLKKNFHVEDPVIHILRYKPAGSIPHLNKSEYKGWRRSISVLRQKFIKQVGGARVNKKDEY